MGASKEPKAREAQRARLGAEPRVLLARPLAESPGHRLACQGDRVRVLRVRHVEDEALDARGDERLDLLADLVRVAHGQDVLEALRIDLQPVRPGGELPVGLLVRLGDEPLPLLHRLP